MAFEVAAEDYNRYMGRYSGPLADAFVALLGPRPGQRALDVGCGPGALTARLLDRLDPKDVAAIDPSHSFVAAVHERWPDLDVRRGSAEELPFADGVFDLAAAQLVVHFMADPVAGLREMGRVAAGGAVAACVWDHAREGNGPAATFWRAVLDVDPTANGESALAGTQRGQLGELARAAGLRDVAEGALTVTVPMASFDEWWQPYTLGVGPAGSYVATLDEAHRAAVRDRCAELLPLGPFETSATAWTMIAAA